MTDRDELIGQALEMLLDADEAHAPEGSMWPELAEAIVDAGWTPPPGGDVVEQATHVLHERFAEDYHDREPARFQAQALADAGLLRTPPQQDANVPRTFPGEGW